MNSHCKMYVSYATSTTESKSKGIEPLAFRGSLIILLTPSIYHVEPAPSGMSSYILLLKRKDEIKLLSTKSADRLHHHFQRK